MSDPSKAVFLSYASQDADAARRICEALRAASVEVWFDQSELVGGDAWDQKIRKQIKDCTLFVPVISANTNARLEGYFRREWRMAVERMHDMDDDMPFLVPVVIDDTSDVAARVPERFRERQWTRLPGGETSRAFVDRTSALLAGEVVPTSSRPAGNEPGRRPARRERRERGSPWLTVFFIVIGLGTGAYYSVILPWLNRHENSAPHATPPLSEADQLVGQARDLLYDYSAARHEFALADDLLNRATALAPNSAAAWGASALTHYFTFFRAYDTNRERLTRSRAAAEKALRLDPANVDALLALGLQRQEQGETARAKELFDRALSADPRNPRVLIAQSILISDRRVRADFLVDAARRVERPAELYLYAGIGLMQVRRFRESVELYDRSFAAEPFWRTYVVRAFAEFFLSADPQKVEAWLDHIPELRADEPRVAIMRYKAAMLRRDGAAAARALEPLTADFIEDNFYIGPKSFLLAQAHETGGHEALALEQWQAAERTVRERLAAEPGNTYWRSLLAVILTGEQRNDEARAAAEACAGEDRRVGAVGGSRLSNSMQSIENTAQAFVRLGDTARAIDLLRAAPFDKYWGYLSAGSLAADPMWEPLRGQPGFEELRTLLERVERAEPEAASAPSLPGAAVAPPTTDTRSVAVLAFANLSDDKGNEYFSDGISEELLNVLAKVPGLKVTARTSAFFFKGKQVPIADIAQQLGVAYVVEGSVRKAGDRVRITAQLIKAADGFHVWSDTFTRDLKDIFAVQDEIAGLIAQNLQLKMDLAPAKRTVNPEAHQRVLEGRHFLNLRTQEGFARAEAAFNKALQLDPQFAQAYAGLADIHWLRTVFASYAGNNYVPGDTGEMARRAIELDPTMAEAYPASGCALHWAGRLPEAEEVFKKAIALNPNYMLGHHWYALLLESQGRLDQALSEIERAIELDPFSAAAHATRHRFLLMAGRISDALEADDRAEALRSGFFFNTGLRAQGLLAAGRREEALAVVRFILAQEELEFRYVSDVSAIYVLRALGHEGEAVTHGGNMLSRLPNDSFMRGLVLAALDRWDEAMPYLERTPRGMCEIFYWNPAWDRSRDDPRFLRLLEKLGCMAEYKVARATLKRMTQEPEAKQ